MPVVALDACVLFQGRVTDLLLHIAEATAFEPIWFDDIHDEWMRNLHSRMGIAMDKIDYRRSEMERAFPAANVRPTQDVVFTVQGLSRTPGQRKDAHVIATAVAAKAKMIVTHNIKDFAPGVLSHYGLSKVRPDPFCVDSLENRQAEVLAGIGAHRSSLKSTPMLAAKYIDHLVDDKVGMAKLALALAPYDNSI